MHAFWLDPDPLILASASATRAALLAASAIPFEAVPSGVDERELERRQPGDFVDAAMMLAEAKALEVAARYPGRLVLGADQTLDLNGTPLYKPEDLAVARTQLARLRGKRHRLTSAIALASGTEVIWRGVDHAELTMRGFSDAFLETYLHAAGNSLTSSVGGYRLEGLGVHLFERVEGEHSTILGLPLLALLPALRQMGALAA